MSNNFQQSSMTIRRCWALQGALPVEPGREWGMLASVAHIHIADDGLHARCLNCGVDGAAKLVHKGWEDLDTYSRRLGACACTCACSSSILPHFAGHTKEQSRSDGQGAWWLRLQGSYY